AAPCLLGRFERQHAIAPRLSAIGRIIISNARIALPVSVEFNPLRSADDYLRIRAADGDCRFVARIGLRGRDNWRIADRRQALYARQGRHPWRNAADGENCKYK